MVCAKSRFERAGAVKMGYKFSNGERTITFTIERSEEVYRVTHFLGSFRQQVEDVLSSYGASIRSLKSLGGPWDGPNPDSLHSDLCLLKPQISKTQP